MPPPIFFHDALYNSPQATHLRGYVEERGLNDDTVQQFGLGYAPDSWDALRDTLLASGIELPDIVAAGLLVERDDGSTYDRFRDRLMIPIRDARGRIIGFGARALKPDAIPKYLNSPQSQLFDKSHVLFGLDAARRTIREEQTAVIVEGYMDVMQAHQAGFDNVVAQMGTAPHRAATQNAAPLRQPFDSGPRLRHRRNAGHHARPRRSTYCLEPERATGL